MEARREAPGRAPGSVGPRVACRLRRHRREGEGRRGAGRSRPCGPATPGRRLLHSTRLPRTTAAPAAPARAFSLKAPNWKTLGDRGRAECGSARRCAPAVRRSPRRLRPAAPAPSPVGAGSLPARRDAGRRCLP